jgi:hypothetical protein
MMIETGYIPSKSKSKKILFIVDMVKTDNISAKRYWIDINKMKKVYTTLWPIESSFNYVNIMMAIHSVIHHGTG